MRCGEIEANSLPGIIDLLLCRNCMDERVRLAQQDEHAVHSIGQKKKHNTT